VVQMTPDFLAVGADDLQSVAVMDLSAIIIKGGAIILRVEEHRCHRRDAKAADVATRVETGGHLHHRVRSGDDLEVIGSRHALAVERGVDVDLLALAGRLLNPELAKARKLLALGGCRVDGQTARRNAIKITATERPEIAGAEERD